MKNHPRMTKNTPGFSLTKKDIVKLFASKSPFATKLKNKRRAEFIGVVTFEVKFS